MQYVVAHGISSMVEGKKVIIGSAHFVFEDEGCRIPEGERREIRRPARRVFPPVPVHRRGAGRRDLHPRSPAPGGTGRGNRACMSCGIAQRGDDDRRQPPARPRPWPREVGVDAVYAEVLPEDKAAFIRQ